MSALAPVIYIKHFNCFRTRFSISHPTDEHVYAQKGCLFQTIDSMISLLLQKVYSHLHVIHLMSNI